MQPLKVYKFGGASVRSAEGIENLRRIVGREKGRLFIVVSAMGKTTNALEEVLDRWMRGDREAAQDRFAEVERYHDEIVRSLFDDPSPLLSRLRALYDEVRTLLGSLTEDDYDRRYDRLVSYGELLSTTVVSEYLSLRGLPNRWIDMRRCLVTDDRYREAEVDTARSAALLREAVEHAPESLFVGQGFIGATPEGNPTTLGREGSDYSAALVGAMLGAESVSIWKDVDGILNADPRLFDDTVLIPRMSYLDAIELAYSGAQIIHPKTIKPLQNAGIPLHVRPFGDSSKPGSVICAEAHGPLGVPVRILKQNQILVSVRPRDFSFVLEQRLPDIFAVFARYRQKINLIQSSAVNLSLCIDDSRHLQTVVDTLQGDFRVVYNKNMELLTVRGYDAESYRRYVEQAPGVYLVQKTRRAVRIVRRKAEP